MDKQKKVFKIYQNEVNNIPQNENVSYRRQMRNSLPSNNNKQEIKNNNNKINKNNIVYKSKKPQTGSIMINNRYHIKNQDKTEDIINSVNNINYNQKINGVKKKYIYPIAESLTNKSDNKKIYIQSIKKEDKHKNYIKLNFDKDIEKEQRKNDIYKYSAKYSNHLNSFYKNSNNKSIEKDKNKNINIHQNNNEENINNSLTKKYINIKGLSKNGENINNLINLNNNSINKNIRPISSNQNYNNYKKLQNGGHVFHYNKELIKEEEINEKIYPETYLCNKCKEKVIIKLNPDLLTINIICRNGHNIENEPINEFIRNINKKELLKCKSCKKNYENKLLFYCSCNDILCNDCIKNKLHINHNQLPYIQKNYFCVLHKKVIILFCKKCNKNICNDCINEHNEHKEEIIYFKNIIPKEKEIKKYKKEIEIIEKSKDKLDKEFDLFIESFKEKRKEFIKKWENYIKVQKDIIDNINNKEFLNYENIENMKNLNLNKNFHDDYTKLEYNFIKKGKYLLNLLSLNDIKSQNYKIQNEIKNFEIKPRNIIPKKNNIIKETSLNIFGEKKINKSKSFNIICKNVNNLFINNSLKKENIEKKEKIIEEIKNLKNVDNNIENQNEIKNEKIKHNGNTKSKIKEKKPKEEPKTIVKKLEVIQKIENCEKKYEKRDERCITSFALLKNNKIVFTYKGGIIKFYEFIKHNNEIQLIELLRLEEDEYCFNYAIELYDDNVAVCSEDGTVKIIKLLLENNNEKYKIIQIIKEMKDDPIYIIKELENKNLVLGCWKNILVYQKAEEYELINKIKIGEYTFSILEISPNEIIASHSESKTLTGHNFNNYKFYTIENVESNENNNIICKYNNKRDIIFVGFNKGINIVSIDKKIILNKIMVNEIISSLCPIEMNIKIGDENKKIWGLMLGAKRKIFGEKVNYAYSMIQIGFNLNEKDEGIINDDKDIKMQIISRKDRIHYYDITNLQNSIWNKNKDTLNIIENKDEQWIFSSGNEDKLIKIWKF